MRHSNDGHSAQAEKQRLHTANGETDVASVVVLERHRGYVLLRYWIHVAAIAVTALLSGLTLANLYYTDASDKNVVAKLGAFQFVAKAHEVLLGASISMIIMDRVRTGLLSAEGVALGRLLSSQQLTSIDYLVSAEFWIPWRGHHSASLRSLPMGFLLLFAIPFAFVSGPLSAIVAVPRPGWSLAKPAALLPLFTNVTADRLWPDVVDASFLKEACFDEGPAEQTSGCPASAAKVIAVTLDPTYGLVQLCSIEKSTLLCNATLSGAANSFGRQMSMQMSLEGASAVVSTLNSRLTSDLSDYMAGYLGVSLHFPGSAAVDTHTEQVIEISLANVAQMYKPVVSTTCRDLTDAEIADVKIPRQGNPSSSPNWTKPALYWTEPITGTSTTLEAVFTWPRNYTYPELFDQPEECGDEASCRAAIFCTVEARWAPVKIWYNTKFPTILYQDNPAPASYNTSGSLRDSTRAIHIGRQWLRNFDRGYAEITGLSPMTYKIGSLWRQWGSRPRASGSSSTMKQQNQQYFAPETYSKALSVILSTVIGEGLAEIQDVFTGGRPVDNNDIFRGRVRRDGPCGTSGLDGIAGDDYGSDIAVLGKEICSKSAAYWAAATSIGNLKGHWTLYKLSIKHYGYGWFRNSVTIELALAVLLFHALLTLLYLGTLPFKKTVSTCWDSLAEVFVLALDSLPASRLAGNSAGVHSSNIWRERVTIREIDGKNQLSLVVGDPTDYGGAIGKLPELGKKYD